MAPGWPEIQTKGLKAINSGGDGTRKKKKKRRCRRAHGKEFARRPILGSAFARLLVTYRQRSLFESIKEIDMMPHRCSNCEETGAKRSETARCKKKKKRNRFVSLASRSLLSLSSSLPVFLPGGCLSQSLSHLQGARLRSSLSWRGSLRRDRAAAAAAEGGAGGRGSLIVVVRERIERLPPLRFFFFSLSREVERGRGSSLFSTIFPSLPLLPLLPLLLSKFPSPFSHSSKP